MEKHPNQAREHQGHLTATGLLDTDRPTWQSGAAMKPRIALRAPETEFPQTGNGPDNVTDAVQADTTVAEPDTAPSETGEAETTVGDAPEDPDGTETPEPPYADPAPEADPIPAPQAAAPDPEPEAPLSPADAFDAEFPAFGSWFDRVQKWAQFNSRPVPEPTPEWEAEFAAKARPHEAAERICMPQT